jgi:hypothetical protein
MSINFDRLPKCKYSIVLFTSILYICLSAVFFSRTALIIVTNAGVYFLDDAEEEEEATAGAAAVVDDAAGAVPGTINCSGEHCKLLILQSTAVPVFAKFGIEINRTSCPFVPSATRVS